MAADEMRISDWRSDVCSSDLLELLARLLVDVRATVDRELLDARRHGNGTADERAGAAGSVGDIAGRLIEHTIIERLQANADVLRFHNPRSEGRRVGKECGSTFRSRGSPYQ